MVDKDAIIKINIEGDYSRNLDFVINALSSIRDITYSIAKDATQTPLSESIKLTKDIKSDYSLEIAEIKLNSFHAALKLKEDVSEVVLPKLQGVIFSLQDENKIELEKVKLSPEIKNSILKKVKEILPKKALLGTSPSVSIELPFQDTVELFKPEPKLAKFINGFIKSHPSVVSEDKKLIGRLIGVQIGNSKSMLLDSVRGKLILKVPSGSENKLIEFTEKHLGQIVELEGVSNVKGRAIIISTLEELKIKETNELLLNSFLGGGHLFKLKEPLSIKIEYSEEDELFILENKDLDIHASSYNLYRAYKNFREVTGDLFYIYTNKYKESDFNENGLRLRQKLLDMLGAS